MCDTLRSHAVFFKGEKSRNERTKEEKSSKEERKITGIAITMKRVCGIIDILYRKLIVFVKKRKIDGKILRRRFI